MKVSELIPVDHICIGWPTRDVPKLKNKWKLIQSTVRFLAEKNGYPDDVCHQIYQKVRDREKSMTTAIGHGIALPHTSMSAINEPCGACVILHDGLDFEAIDHEPVQIIFLVLIPDNEYRKYISILSNIVDFTSNPDNREILLKSDNPQTIWNAISYFEE